MLNATTKQFSWAKFLKFYSEQNAGRITRLGVFDNGNDYWLEDGLTLRGIDIDTHAAAPVIELLLGDKMTHTIQNVRKVQISFSLDEVNDGLDILDADGAITILRYENH